MDSVTLKVAKAEAKRFLQKVKDLESKLEKDPKYTFYGCKETGALKRSSMDLTRALTELRKPQKFIKN